jgi:hypothetical protein
MINFKKIITLTGVLISINRLQAQTANFNFSLASQPLTGWINIAGDPSLSVLAATDPATGITISSVATANWSQFNSGSSFDGLGATNGSFFPAAVMLNHWYNYDGTLANYQAAKPQLRLTGLNKNALYTIRMAGSSTSSLNNNPTRYTVAGSTIYAYLDVNNHNNTLNGAVFNNISPDTTGTIRVYVNTITTTDIADISGLQITSQPFPVPNLVFTSGLTQSSDSVRLGGTLTTPFNLSAPNAVYGPVDVGIDQYGTFRTRAYWSDGISTYGSDITLDNVAGTMDTYASIPGFSSMASIDYFSSTTPGQTFISLTATDFVNNRGVSGALYLNSRGASLVGPLHFANYNNNTAGDSVLSTDNNGSVVLRALSSFSSVGHWLSSAGTSYDSLDNIGIGTSNTQGYKLAVNGNAIFSSVKVKAPAAWPDYVFKKDYHLPLLKDLEKYITAHRHLPGIPSAEMVNKDGQDLGANQAALLKKIEELTLYVIELNKKVEQLSQENEQIKKQKPIPNGHKTN